MNKTKATAILASGLLVASVGCGAGLKSGGSHNPIGQNQQGQQGTGLITFAIPIHAPGSQFHAGPQVSKSGARTESASPRPQFIDNSANGNFVIFLDGAQVLSANFTPTWNGNQPVLGNGPSGSGTFPDGTISYSSVVNQNTSNGVTTYEIDVTVSLTTTAQVSHTFGIVQENGACVGTDPCLGDSYSIGQGYTGVNNGYVLAEGQTSFTLQPGSSNPGVSLTLNGVLEAGFLCTDAACDGTLTQNSDGSYSVIAYPVDENGNAVTSPTYSNGWWEVEEADGKKLVTINTTNPQPFNSPNIDKNGWDAEPFTFTCNGTGQATLALVLNNNSATGPVTGFTYNNTNYPQPNAVLGSVGADLYYGGTLTFQCETYGTVSIAVN